MLAYVFIMVTKIFQSTEIVKDGNIYTKADILIHGEELATLVAYINGNGTNGTSWTNANLSFNDDYTLASATNVILLTPSTDGIVYRLVATQGIGCIVSDVQIKYKN
jgi:hypothetical protein